MFTHDLPGFFNGTRSSIETGRVILLVNPVSEHFERAPISRKQSIWFEVAARSRRARLANDLRATLTWPPAILLIYETVRYTAEPVSINTATSQIKTYIITFNRIKLNAKFLLRRTSGITTMINWRIINQRKTEDCGRLRENFGGRKNWNGFFAGFYRNRNSNLFSVIRILKYYWDHRVFTRKNQIAIESRLFKYIVHINILQLIAKISNV